MQAQIFIFPDKTNLVNDGKGYNYGVELTLGKIFIKDFITWLPLLFESKYKGSDNVWRNTAFNSNYVSNFLAGKEFKLTRKTSFGIDTKSHLPADNDIRHLIWLHQQRRDM